MTNVINGIQKELTDLKKRHNLESKKVTDRLQQEFELIFHADDQLQSTIKDLENHHDITYCLLEYGLFTAVEVDLSEYSDSLEYLTEYLSELFIQVDFANDCIMMYQGDDFINIQNDTRHGNGVWQGQDLIIQETEYLDDNEEVNETLRNKLIEEHMEKTGYFPAVGITTNYGDFFLVNTSEGA